MIDSKSDLQLGETSNVRHVVIARPQANPMQSGRAHLTGWKMIFSTAPGQYIDPLMGWTGTNNMQAELTLHFNRVEEAVAYAKAQGWTYSLVSPEPDSASLPLPNPKRYADNFLSPRVR